MDAKTGVTGFRSIPYAENPVADLRYAPPVARSNWTQTHDGVSKAAIDAEISRGSVSNLDFRLYQTSYGPSCVTSGDLTFARPREVADSDCLTVSVYVPPNTDSMGEVSFTR